MYSADKIAAFDTETDLIQPGRAIPELVCASMSEPGHDAEVVHNSDRALLIGSYRCYLVMDQVVTGANIAFDHAVMAHKFPELLPDIFAMYNSNQVYDVQIAQQLDAIANGHFGLDPKTGKPIKNKDGKPGRYSLDFCVRQMLGRDDAKALDFWRTRYGILKGVPLSEWPADALAYPKHDAVNTRDVALAQLQKPLRNLQDMNHQVRAAFAMHLGAAWGIRTDPTRVAALEARVDIAHADMLSRFQTNGFIKPDGKEDARVVKRAVCFAYGPEQAPACPECRATGKVRSPKTGNEINCKTCDSTGIDLDYYEDLPRTNGGGISTSRDTLVESGDEDLAAYGENQAEKLRDTYVPFLKLGLHHPITVRPNVLVESGRTSYDGVIQLLPRSGGVRECFCPRPGCVFCSVDFGALELCTLAQVCLWILGHSRMAEIINETGDPGLLHTSFGARLLGKSVAEMVALIEAEDFSAVSARQGAKAGGFGFGGGMGAAKLVINKREAREGTTVTPGGQVYPGIRFCVLFDRVEICGAHKITEWKGRKYSPMCKRCVEIVAEDLKPAWLDLYPEMKEYFQWVTARVESTGELPCFGLNKDAQIDVVRVRGGLNFTEGSNHMFQHLAAAGIKEAAWALAEQCYLDKQSVLFNTRPLFILHDEIFAEMPEHSAYLAGPRMAEVMRQQMQRLTPDIKLSAKPTLMKFWYKDAKPVYDSSERLVPWEPKIYNLPIPRI